MTSPTVQETGFGAAASAGADHRPGGSRPRSDARRRRRGEGTRQVARWWWSMPAAVLVVVMMYGGIGAGSFYAFTDWRGIGSFEFVGFDNFARIFTNPAALTAVWNTLFLAALFLVLTNVIGMALAVALHRTLRSRNFLRTLLFMPVVLSPLAVAYVWKFIFQQEGPLNELLFALGLDSWTRAWLGNPDTAIWTILVVLVWQHLGLTMVIYLAGLVTVPEELEEAGAVDGANAWTRFFRIVLPQLRPTIVIASSLILIQGLRVFDQVQAMTGGGPFNATETLATLVYKETFVNGRYGYGAALSLLLTVLIAFFALLQIGLLRERKA